ncbi:MAG: hypothetical protein LBV43_02330 [Prevotella sp.]|jgi:uncharacterized membrane protein SpoIIM required for sporulation|nr:hypothetical protein [Prevotella sp.]
MKEKDKIQDEKFRELFSGTKIGASENLKFRIMHQIEAEKALSSKKRTNVQPLISNMLSIFGVMYLLIAVVGLTIYLNGGKSALESVTFFIPVILIASVCGMFWMISIYDDRRRSKQKHK